MLRKQIGKFYNTFVCLKGRPKDIALAFAIGTAIGFCPIIGAHILLTAATAILLRMNMTSMYLASWLICNPLTGIPVLIAEYHIGRFILRLPHITLPDVWNSSAILDLGWALILPLLIGWLVLSGIIAPLSYPVIRAYFRRLRAARQLKVQSCQNTKTAP